MKWLFCFQGVLCFIVFWAEMEIALNMHLVLMDGFENALFIELIEYLVIKDVNSILDFHRFTPFPRNNVTW